MATTKVIVDERLVARAMQLLGLETEREAVEFALRAVLAMGDDPYARALSLEGSGWEPDLASMRDESVA